MSFCKSFSKESILSKIFDEVLLAMLILLCFLEINVNSDERIVLSLSKDSSLIITAEIAEKAIRVQGLMLKERRKEGKDGC